MRLESFSPVEIITLLTQHYQEGVRVWILRYKLLELIDEFAKYIRPNMPAISMSINATLWNE